MRLLGMSLQTRCCASPNHTGPSPHLVPVYKLSTAALKSVRFLNSGETTSKLSMAESIHAPREQRLSCSHELLHLGSHSAARIGTARNLADKRAPHHHSVDERLERTDLLPGGDTESAEHLHAGGQRAAAGKEGTTFLVQRRRRTRGSGAQRGIDAGGRE